MGKERKSKLNAGVFSSKTCLWATPSQLFDKLNAQFGPFTLDVCASNENAKVPARFFTEKDDGLSQNWEGNKCWMNPPYGREIAKWVKKAKESGACDGTTVCCLLPARTDTAWWHENVPNATYVGFLRGRVHFNGAGPAPFPSVVVVFGELRPASPGAARV